MAGNSKLKLNRKNGIPYQIYHINSAYIYTLKATKLHSVNFSVIYREKGGLSRKIRDKTLNSQALYSFL